MLRAQLDKIMRRPALRKIALLIESANTTHKGIAMWKIKIAALSLICFSGYSWGAGEVLKLETSGTQYCEASVTRLTPKTARDLWLKIDNDRQATLYLDQDLTDSIAIFDMDSSMISSDKAAFSAFFGDANNHIVAVGIMKYDKSGYIKSINATAIRRGILNTCYAIAKVSGERINVGPR